MMDPHSGATMSAMIMASAILVVAYALIFSEVIHRTLAAIIGAVAMVAVGMSGGFYSQAGAVAAVVVAVMLPGKRRCCRCRRRRRRRRRCCCC